MLADYQAIVEDLVRNPDGVLDSADIDEAIASAVLEYSAARPRQVVADLTADGTYRLDLPAGWIADFSEIVSVEHPVGEAPEPSYLDRSLVDLYSTPSGQQLSLPVAVTAGETVRVTYTAHHTVDASTDTIRTDHRHGVAAGAASLLCLQLAEYYATDGSPTIAADSVDHRTKTDRYRSLAKDYAQRYARVAQVSPSNGPGPAFAIADWDRLAQDGGDRIYHGRRRR